MMFQPIDNIAPSYLPHTVEEVVELLYLDLQFRDKVILASLSERELESSVYLALAKTIRREFGLHSGNEPLLASCSNLLGKKYDKYEDPAMVIIKELWKKIKRSHTLHRVK